MTLHLLSLSIFLNSRSYLLYVFNSIYNLCHKPFIVLNSYEEFIYLSNDIKSYGKGSHCKGDVQVLCERPAHCKILRDRIPISQCFFKILEISNSKKSLLLVPVLAHKTCTSPFMILYISPISRA